MSFFWMFLLGLLVVIVVIYLLSLRKVYNIKNKHVLVTGGSSGIGKAIAIDAIKKGASAVTIVARNRDRLKQAKSEIEGFIKDTSNQKVYAVSGDVSSSEIRDKLLKSVSQTSHVDVLINCAGITHNTPFIDTTAEKFEELLRVNVLGYIHPTKALLPAMISKREGRVVFISSQAGQLGLYGYSAYSTSKYALRGLAETLSMEMAPHNIKVSISFPPDTDTPQLQGEQRDDIQKELASYGKIFEAESIAHDVWFGVERSRFQITHGFDGFMMGVVAGGFGPVHCLWDAVTQVMFMGIFRMVTFFYLWMFYKVVREGAKKKQ